jgi:hypothetical protein
LSGLRRGEAGYVHREAAELFDATGGHDQADAHRTKADADDAPLRLIELRQAPNLS